MAILVDGSNFLNELDRAGLGFPALEPLMRLLSDPDDLLFAHFYAAAPRRDSVPHYQNWQRFTAANRNVKKLRFVPGYRNISGKEKGVDVALSVDLTIGACHKQFDRAVVVTADGDMKYAIERAVRYLKMPVTVALIDGMTYAGLAKSFARQGATIFPLRVADLVGLKICAVGRFAATPVQGVQPPATPPNATKSP